MYIGTRPVPKSVMLRVLPNKTRELNRVSCYRDGRGGNRFVLEGRDATHQPWDRLLPKLSREVLEQLFGRMS